MCMADYGDGGWLRHRLTTPVANKVHRCGECGRDIQPGERYERDEGLMGYDGDARGYCAKTCENCVAARSWLERVCRGWIYEMVYEDLREHWDDGWDLRSLWLGRALVGMRNRWKRRDGTLMDRLPAYSGRTGHESAA